MGHYGYLSVALLTEARTLCCSPGGTYLGGTLCVDVVQGTHRLACHKPAAWVSAQALLYWRVKRKTGNSKSRSRKSTSRSRKAGTECFGSTLLSTRHLQNDRTTLKTFFSLDDKDRR